MGCIESAYNLNRNVGIICTNFRYFTCLLDKGHITFQATPSFSTPNEKTEELPISQLILEQWNKYIQENSSAAKELLIEKNQMRNWNEFFKKREKSYKEKNDHQNANQLQNI